MAYGWFICPMQTVDGGPPFPLRLRCAMDDFTPQINAEGGKWAYTDVLGNVALVKVRASDTLLTTIGGTQGFIRITNKFVLSDTLADLTAVQRNAIQNRLLVMGYTQTEINAAMGSTLAQWQTHTFLDLLNLIAAKRFKILPPPNNFINRVPQFSTTVVTPKRPTEIDREVV